VAPTASDSPRPQPGDLPPPDSGNGSGGQPGGPAEGGFGDGSASQPDGPADGGFGDGSASQPGGPAEGGFEDGSESQPGSAAPAAPQPRTGRNLPVAVGVGIGLGGLAVVTLFTVKATFLAYVGVAAGIALWELSRALGTRGIRMPLAPVAVGGAAAVALAYWQGQRALAACVAITVIAILAWRLRGGTVGYLRDVTAGIFALAYLPLMASFVALMLAAPDGHRRTLVFLIVTVCSDVGGYFAGILIGRHLMAPVVSPKKTWEGLGGSVFACILGGAIAVPLLLHAAPWRGVLVGAAAVTSATLGDLAESMIKRDLQIKDMGTVLPGHGGILDRIDSLLIAAPVVWLLLTVLVPLPH
jgi:phosphatidate cytidylyltransferase